MSDFLKQLAIWIPRVISVLTVLVGLLKSVPAAQAVSAAQASGTFASAETNNDLANGINLTTGGVLASVLAFGIPWLVKLLGGKLRARKINPGYVAAIDRAALETLIQTRAGKVDDAPHIEALVKSAKTIEFDEIVAPLRAALPKPVGMPGMPRPLSPMEATLLASVQ